MSTTTSNINLVNALDVAITKLEVAKKAAGNDCTTITSLPLFDGSHITSLSHMFEGCKSLTEITLVNVSGITDMSYAFNDCNLLKTINGLDTTYVTDMSYAYANCAALNNVPEMNTSKVKIMKGMFYKTSPWIENVMLDTSRCIDMRSMFEDAKFISLPEIDTSNVYSMERFCCNNTTLRDLPLLNMYKCTTENTVLLPDSNEVAHDPTFLMFHNCVELTNIGGFQNLCENLDLSASKKITKDSVLNIFDNLATVTDKSLKFNAEAAFWNELTEDDLQIATDKGWKIVKMVPEL